MFHLKNKITGWRVMNIYGLILNGLKLHFRKVVPVYFSKSNLQECTFDHELVYRKFPQRMRTSWRFGQVLCIKESQSEILNTTNPHVLFVWTLPHGKKKIQTQVVYRFLSSSKFYSLSLPLTVIFVWCWRSGNQHGPLLTVRPLDLRNTRDNYLKVTKTPELIATLF